MKYRRQDTGRNGMTADQVLRGAILKQYRELTYEELAFHPDDSQAFRSFARLDMGQYPRDSTLQANITAIGADTWEAVNRAVLGFAAQQKVEQGRTVRVDSTVVESTIHHPTDSTLLEDGIRVIIRLLHQGKALNPATWYTFVDHQRAAKKRGLQILNARKDQVRLKAYRGLLSLAQRVRGYALQAITELKGFVGRTWSRPSPPICGWNGWKVRCRSSSRSWARPSAGLFGARRCPPPIRWSPSLSGIPT